MKESGTVKMVNYNSVYYTFVSVRGQDDVINGCVLIFYRSGKDGPPLNNNTMQVVPEAMEGFLLSKRSFSRFWKPS